MVFVYFTVKGKYTACEVGNCQKPLCKEYDPPVRSIVAGWPTVPFNAYCPSLLSNDPPPDDITCQVRS